MCQFNDPHTSLVFLCHASISGHRFAEVLLLWGSYLIDNWFTGLGSVGIVFACKSSAIPGNICQSFTVVCLKIWGVSGLQCFPTFCSRACIAIDYCVVMLLPQMILSQVWKYESTVYHSCFWALTCLASEQWRQLSMLFLNLFTCRFDNSLCYFWTCSPAVFPWHFVQWFAQILGRFITILIYTCQWRLIKSVGRNGSRTLLFVMKVMVWHFVSQLPSKGNNRFSYLVTFKLLQGFLCYLIVSLLAKACLSWT